MRYRYREMNTRGKWYGWSTSISFDELQSKIERFKGLCLVAFEYQEYTDELGKLLFENDRKTTLIIHPNPEGVIAGELKSWKKRTRKLFESLQN